MNIEYLFYNLRQRLMFSKWENLSINEELSQYAERKFITKDVYNRELSSKILSGKPLCVARFGTTELSCMKAFEFNLKKVQSGNMSVMQRQSGFFPNDIAYGFKFLDEMKSTIPEVDILGTEFSRCEEYFIKKYMNVNLVCTRIRDLAPFSQGEDCCPWSKALEGKKVLVVHPFTDTIRSQYAKRTYLFANNKEFLPEFDLKLVKAVQSIGGEHDSKYSNWFDALDDMTDQVLKQDFDIALIGCGAYGMPLAARIKKSGKQAIHLGGITQGLFGIKCKRFDEAPDYGFVRKWYTDSWVYPSAEETPSAGKYVEGGCYWK